MDPMLGILVMALFVFLAIAISGYLFVLRAVRIHVPSDRSAIKAFALTLSSYCGSGIIMSTAFSVTGYRRGPFGNLVPTPLWIQFSADMLAWILALSGSWFLVRQFYNASKRTTTSIALPIMIVITMNFAFAMFRHFAWILQTGIKN